MAWSYNTPPDGSIILSDAAVYYVDIGNGPGLLFPEPLLINVAAGFWVVSSNSPQTYQGRTLQLQALGDNGWYNVDVERNESDLPYGPIALINLDILEIRFKYTLENGCVYYSGVGTFDPPVVPPAECDIVPDFSVGQVVDASQEGLLTTGRYYIATNNYNVTNTWSLHVNQVVDRDGTTDTFTVLTDYQTVYDQATQVYWWYTPNGSSPLFQPYTLTAVAGGYSISSDYPEASAAGNRFVSVEGYNGTSWVIIWSGYEYDLPIEVPPFGVFTQIRTTYTYSVDCSYTVPGTVVQDTVIEVTSDCSSVEYFFYRYRDMTEGNATWLFTAPEGEAVTVTFWAGEIESGGVVSIYDGPDNTAPLIGTNSGFTNLAGLTFQSTGNQMFIEITQALADMPSDYTTWWWQMSCAPGSAPPAATVSTTAKCDEYQLGIAVNVTDMGGNAELEVQYTVDGGPIEVVDGITATGTYSIGNFPYQSEVILYLVVTGDPLQSQVLGTFTGDPEDCVNPCTPEGNAKVDDQFDLSELPEEGLYDGWKVLISSDTQNIGTYPIGTALEWNLPPGEYVPFDYDPGVIGVGAPQTYWYSNGPGTQPYPLFPVPILQPTGNVPLNWRIYTPDIVFYSIPTNTPMALEVRTGFGPWTQVWTGTLQQTNVPWDIAITPPFTDARIVWDWATCGLTGGVDIQLG